MAKVLISLISEQTIPNVLIINTFKDEYDKYVFITTHQMTQPNKCRHEWIINVTQIANKFEVIIVNPESIQDILEKLNGRFTDDEILVNLTCGNKLMSLAVYQYFSKLSSVSFCYIPIPNNFYINFSNNNRTNIDVRLGVDEYLLSYGIMKQSASMCLKTDEYTEEFFKMFTNVSENKLDNYDFDVIEKLRLFWRNTNATLEEIAQTEKDQSKSKIENIKEFLTKINFPLEKEGKLLSKESKYLTGGWFEEYVFHKIKKTLALSEQDILLGVVLPQNSNTLNNDLDVVFTYENALHVVECKSAMVENGRISTKLFNETVYKAAALKKYFGLNAKSYLFTLTNFEKKAPNQVDYFERANVLGIQLLDEKYFFDDKKFQEDFINRIRR